MKKNIIILSITFLSLMYINFNNLNIGFLSNYSIDEYAFHGSLLNMYEGLVTFDIKKLFSFSFYSYGFSFFFLNLLAVSPFIYYGNTEMVIYIPRIITALFAIGSVWYVYKIARMYVDEYSSTLISLVLFTMPGFWKNAMWFHPDWMMTFFIVLAIYFLAKDNWNFKKYFWWSSISFGISIAIKIQAITFLPVVFIFIFYDSIRFRYFDDIFFKIKLLFKYIGLSLGIFVFTNPYLIHPAGLKAFIASFIVNMKSNATNHGSNVKVSISSKIYNAIDVYYLNYILFYFLVLLSLYMAFLLFKKEKKKSMLPILGCYFCINILYLFLMVNKDWQHYYLSIFTIAPLLLLSLILKFDKYKYILLIAIISLQIISHIPNYKFELSTGFQQKKELSVAKQKEISNVLLKELRGQTNEKTNILISSYQPFDYKKLGLNYKNIDVLYEPIDLSMINLDAFLEKSMTKDSSNFKKIDLVVLSKQDVYFDKQRIKSGKYSKSLKIIENFNNGGNLGYEKFADNKYFYIWKKVK